MLGKIRHAAAFARGCGKKICFLFSGRRFTAGKRLRLYRDVLITADRTGRITAGDEVSVRERALISAVKGGNISIGDGCGIGLDCKIVSHEKIDIGKNTILAPGVLIYDHDHKYGICGVKKHEFVNSPIKIGENCWIGAYSVILRGSSIGNNCVIAAHSVVKGNVPDGSVYIQKRETVLIKKSDAEENT